MTTESHEKHVPASLLFGNQLIALAAIQANPMIRIRELSSLLNLTERSTQRVVHDLETAGLITVSREGRRNHYTVTTNVALRLPDGRHVPIDLLLDTLSRRTATG
jgi:DNA-binding MarR family transcriptional regulator